MKRKGSVPNEYIPAFSPVVFRRIIARLSLKSINNLAYLWCRLKSTQPDLRSSREYKQNKLTQTQLVLKAIDFFTRNAQALQQQQQQQQQESQSDNNSEISSNNKKIAIMYSKKQLIDKILVEFWHKGLNLLQISQVDCQLILDKPNSHKWISSKLINNFNQTQEVKILMPNFQHLAATISKHLNSLYLNHVYLCHHPFYPLIILRVQLFDILSGRTTRTTSTSTSTPTRTQASQDNNNLITRKPFFIAIPSSSSFIIHSTFNANDIAPKIILQSLEKALSGMGTDTTNLIHLVTSQDSLSQVNNFESVFLLNANSRFSNSLGSWSCYADNRVDILPFDDPLTHNLIKNLQDSNDLSSQLLLQVAEQSTADDSSELEIIDDETQIREINKKRVRKIANLRFKGSVDGQLKSKRLYEDVRAPLKKLKVNVQKPTHNENKLLQRNFDKNKYSSIIPIQHAEFVIHNNLLCQSISSANFKKKDAGKASIGGDIVSKLNVNNELTKPKFKIKLTGNDIYAGLHELATEGIVDPVTVPGWLTGEEGSNSGIIVKRKFYEKFDNVGQSGSSKQKDYFKQFETGNGAII